MVAPKVPSSKEPAFIAQRRLEIKKKIRTFKLYSLWASPTTPATPATFEPFPHRTTKLPSRFVEEEGEEGVLFVVSQ
jgi:hypothetical protein